MFAISTCSQSGGRTCIISHICVLYCTSLFTRTFLSPSVRLGALCCLRRPFGFLPRRILPSSFTEIRAVPCRCTTPTCLPGPYRTTFILHHHCLIERTNTLIVDRKFELVALRMCAKVRIRERNGTSVKECFQKIEKANITTGERCLTQWM